VQAVADLATRNADVAQQPNSRRRAIACAENVAAMPVRPITMAAISST